MRNCLSFFSIAFLALVAIQSEHLWGQNEIANAKGADSQVASLIEIPFPLSSQAESGILQRLEELASRSSANERPLVVLEFTKGKDTAKGADDTIGWGTSFERALALSRWLSGPKGSRIRSVAFLPNSICGHAVLIALGCEEIAIASQAEIGRAGINEPVLDSTIRQAYLDVASKRGAFPAAAILSLIDPAESLVRIDKKDGTFEFSTLPQIAEKLRDEDAWKETQLVPNNQLAVYVGHELRSTWRWVAHLANDREQLSQALKLKNPLTEKPVMEGPVVAIRVHLTGIVSQRQVNRIIRAIEEGVKRNEVNLIVIEVDSAGGNLNESMRLANYLSGIVSDRISVVSYLSGSARGDAALIPLASDLIFMHPDAKLGGPGEATISVETCNENKETLKALAKSTGRSEGELLGCICPDMPLFEYNTFDGAKQISNPDWIVNDPQWTKGDAVSFRGGLSYARASELGLATDNPISIEAVGNRFGIEKLPEEVTTNRTEQFIERLASQAWLSMFLFLVGIVCLSAELTTPGMGIAGIISAICFLLFFWIHLFQGTVEWLEILLILAGVVCLVIELFLLPGFGVFGVTGILLLAAGLLLAGQTFVVPTNEYQWERTAQGIGQLGLIVISLFGAAIVFRKQLANLPMIRWFALQPPREDKELIEKEKNEEELHALIGWSGVTISRCNPSGKASIGDRIMGVVSQDSWIDEDTEIEVVGLTGNNLIVKSKSNSGGNS